MRSGRVARCCIAALLMVLPCACDKGAAPAMPGRPPPPVTAARAITRDAPIYLDEIGRTTASQLVNIQSQVAGQIMERRFQDGDQLKKGQVLFIIDQRPFQAKVDEAKANLEQAKSQLELAQLDYDRMAKAYQSHAASIEDRDTKKGALDNAKAQQEVNQAALDTAQLNLSYCTISSPIDGRAGQRQVDVGNVVKENDATLLTIQTLSPIYADFTITERDLPRVRQRMADGTLKAQVTVPEHGDVVKEGDLTFLDTAVMQGAGRIRLRATIANSDLYFWPGQFVNVRLVLKVIPKAVLIPYQCVQIGQQGPYVYIIDNDLTATQRPVTLGQRQESQIVIENGVTAGEEVVQTGQLSVNPGGKVRIVPAVSATAEASNSSASSDAVFPPGTAPATKPANAEGNTHP